MPQPRNRCYTKPSNSENQHSATKGHGILLTKAETPLSDCEGILEANCSWSKSQTMIHEISPDAYCTLHFYIKIEEMKCKSHIESTRRSLYWPKLPTYMQLVYETGTLDSSSRLTLAIQGCREKQSTNKLRAETAYKEKTMNLNKTLTSGLPNKMSM